MKLQLATALLHALSYSVVAAVLLLVAVYHVFLRGSVMLGLTRAQLLGLVVFVLVCCVEVV